MNTSDRKIRLQRATPNDVPVILDFISQLAEYERLSDKVETTEERLHETLFGSQSFAKSVIAYDADTPVAFAVYFFNYSTFAGRPGLYLEDIFVLPEYRGSGVGRQLFAFLAREAVAHDCSRLQLSVLDWNQPSIDFYKRLGGEPFEGWTVFNFSEDSLRQLAEPTAKPQSN